MKKKWKKNDLRKGTIFDSNGNERRMKTNCYKQLK